MKSRRSKNSKHERPRSDLCVCLLTLEAVHRSREEKTLFVHTQQLDLQDGNNNQKTNEQTRMRGSSNSHTHLLPLLLLLLLLHDQF